MPSFFVGFTMALPTGTTRGSGLTRSEAAILAWKKRARKPKAGALDPKIAARVKQILAEKANKGKKKAPKGKAKPQQTTEQKKQAKQDQIDNNRSAVYDKTGLSDDGVDAVNALEAGEQPKNADALVKQGLAEKDSAGKVRLSAAGHAYLHAADRGDAGAAAEAVSRGGDKTAKEAAQRAKVEKAAAAQAKQQAKQQQMKQAAGKVKEKAKAAAPKAQAAAPKEQSADAAKKQGENRAKVAQAMAEQDAGLSPSGSAALASFSDGKPLDNDTATQFEAMGLTERGSDGAHRLTSEGRAAAAAMNKGDVRGAIDAISKAADTKKKKADGDKAKADKATAAAARTSERDKAKADAERRTTEKTTKDDASRARVEAARIEAAKNRGRKALDMSEPLTDISDHTVDLLYAIKAGARHSRSDIEHLQRIHDSSVACGASCGADEGVDDEAELLDDDPGAEKAIKGIMENPQWYAAHECGDIMQASAALNTLAMLIQSELAEEDEDDQHVAMLADAAETLVDFVRAELDELRGAAKEAASTQRMGPMNKAVDDLSLHIDGGAVKALDDDNIRGYAVLFGDSEHPDLQRDYFTKATDFWLDHWGWPKPITYHHGMDAATRNDPVVGHWKAAGVDDVGVWMEGQIDRAHAYYKAMKELAQRGYLRLSSDSAPQWVIRERQPNGVNSIKRWPLVTSSVTVTPMEPRMLPVEVKALMAEIGLDAIDTNNPEAINPASAPDGAKADDSERARRLLLELDLLELESAT